MRGSLLALVSHYLLILKNVCLEKAFKGIENILKLSCCDALKEACLPLGQKDLSPFARQKKKKKVLRACYSAARESVHKRNGLCCPEGFPARVSLVSSKVTGKWQGWPTFTKECLCSPGSESGQAAGQGKGSRPKKGLFGNHRGESE